MVKDEMRRFWIRSTTKIHEKNSITIQIFAICATVFFFKFNLIEFWFFFLNHLWEWISFFFNLNHLDCISVNASEFCVRIKCVVSQVIFEFFCKFFFWIFWKRSNEFWAIFKFLKSWIVSLRSNFFLV